MSQQKYKKSSVLWKEEKVNSQRASAEASGEGAGTGTGPTLMGRGFLTVPGDMKVTVIGAAN